MIRARRPFTALYYLHRVTALFPVCSGVIPRREMARHVFSSLPPFPQPYPPPRPPSSPACDQPLRVATQGRVDVPVFRVSRLFIIIIAIADLMSKPNATASAVFFYYRQGALPRVARERDVLPPPPRPPTRRDGACTTHFY